MRNTLITRKTVLLITFLYSFFTYAQQLEIKTEDWKGNVENCIIENNHITCITDEETTLFIPGNYTAKVELEMNINIDNVKPGENSILYIYPLVNDVSNIEDCQKMKIHKREDGTAISFENSQEEFLNKRLSNIIITLKENGEWEFFINNVSGIKGDFKSGYVTGQAFALKFKNMKNARLENIKMTSHLESEDDQNNPDPDDPPNPGSEDPESDKDESVYGDIVFSEIMSNPKGCPGYPEIEYIEIYNRTDKRICLYEWELRYGDSKYLVPMSYIEPYDYMIMTHEKHSEEWEMVNLGKRIDMERFPVLSNSGKKLFLHNKNNKLIAYTHYSPTRYNDKIKEEGGFSIERIDLNNINDTRYNWSASNSPLGGTPAQKNSIDGKCSYQEPATFLYHEFLSPDTICLHFNSPLNMESAVQKENYSVTGGVTEIVTTLCDSIYMNSIYVLLSKPLEKEEKPLLSITGLTQIDGTDVIIPQQINISLPYKAETKELTFNEILFDADNNTCEYVELYNNSSKCLVLGDLTFATIGDSNNYTKTSKLSEDNRIIEPHSFIVFTSDTAKLLSKWNIPMWNISDCNLPSLNNDGGTIALINKSAEHIDTAVFSPSIYPKTGTGSKGVSAEKVNPDYESNNLSNWLPATANSNYGTPGKTNSQYTNNISDNSNNGFALTSNHFSPDNDGFEDYVTISYSLDKGGYIANIKIFSSNGREVAYPFKRETLAEKGSVIWNGKDQNGDYLTPGIYIILIEAHHETGSLIKKKLAIAIN